MITQDFKIGDLVNYHSIINRPATSHNHKITRFGKDVDGDDVAFITGKAGYVSMAALSHASNLDLESIEINYTTELPSPTRCILVVMASKLDGSERNPAYVTLSEVEAKKYIEKCVNKEHYTAEIKTLMTYQGDYSPELFYLLDALAKGELQLKSNS